MTTRSTILGFGFGLLCLAAQAQEVLQELTSYLLPSEVERSVATVAGECDILVLGEVHGMQEVPAVAASLLAPLSKLEYRGLALEIPHDEQAAMVAWAMGTTEDIPSFFAKPGADGRGNEQVLALVRCALRPPYDWKLICFDETEAEMRQQMMAKQLEGTNVTADEIAAKLSFDDIVALSVKRDATMAANFAAERQRLSRDGKILAICGNLHARTLDHAAADSPIKKFWPSFAAVLKRDHPNWRVESINVRAFSGEYFNDGKVNKIGERPLDKVTFRRTENADFGYELELPKATVATFLQTPTN